MPHAITSDTLADLLLGLSGPDTDRRLQKASTSLVTHLHAFAGATGLTHGGETTDDERNEFVLSTDVLDLSSLVDMINSPADYTSSSVLGLFHSMGELSLPAASDRFGDTDGPQVVVEGRLPDHSAALISGAKKPRSS